jgi:hypothetical protein
VRARLAVFAAAAVGAVLVAAARADESIREVNNQESLFIALAPVHLVEAAADAQGASFVSHVHGTRYVFGFDEARTRTILGIPDLYTDLEFALGVATLDYEGRSLDAGSAPGADVTVPVSYGDVSVRLRLGRSFESRGAARLAITPFLGFTQQAWLRDHPTAGNASFYDSPGMQVGALAQASLPGRLVMGADASVGRNLGAILFGRSYGNVIFAKESTLSLKLDHRTAADWHQRLEIRQTWRRYGVSADAPGYYEPQHGSDLAIMLEFGTESGIF